MKKLDKKENIDSLVMFEGGVLEKGYGIVAKQVMQDTNLHVIAKCLYSYLCTYGNGAFPSRELVMGHLGIGKDSFQKYMKQLKDYGYITSKQKVVNGKFSGNVYTIEQTIKPCTIKPDTVEKPKKPCLVSSDTVVSDTVKPDTNSTSSFNSTSSNNNTTTEPPVKPIIVVAPLVKNNRDAVSEPITASNDDIMSSITIPLPKGILPKHIIKLANRKELQSKTKSEIVAMINAGLKFVKTYNKPLKPVGLLTSFIMEGYNSPIEVDLFDGVDSLELTDLKNKFQKNEQLYKESLAKLEFDSMIGVEPVQSHLAGLSLVAGFLGKISGEKNPRFLNL